MIVIPKDPARPDPQEYLGHTPNGRPQLDHPSLYNPQQIPLEFDEDHKSHAHIVVLIKEYFEGTNIQNSRRDDPSKDDHTFFREYVFHELEFGRDTGGLWLWRDGFQAFFDKAGENPGENFGATAVGGCSAANEDGAVLLLVCVVVLAVAVPNNGKGTVE